MNKTIAGNDTIWKICIYVRLSKEEIRKNKTESESIINQKSILLSWIDQYFSTERHTVYGIFEDAAVIIGLKTLRLKKCQKHAAF